MKARSSWLMVAGLALLAGAVAAEETGSSPATTRVLDESVGVSVNALGLQHVLDLRWLRPLNTSRNPLLAGAHTAAGLSHQVTPSYMRFGAWVEVSPLSILDLRAGVEPGAYFGTFGSLRSFSSYADRFDRGVQDTRKDKGRSGSGARVYLAPTLKLKVGPFVAASGADLEWWRSNAAGPFYYEPARNTLLKVGGDRLLSTSTVVLRQHDLGARGRFSYGVGHYLTYVLDAPANKSQRVGVVMVHQFGRSRFGVHAPRIGSQVSYYLNDPSRQGQLAASLGLSIGLAP